MLRIDVTAAVKAGQPSVVPRRASQRERRRPRSHTPYTPGSGRGPRGPSMFRSVACPPRSVRSPGATYPADNLVIGYPLAYQYLTSLRPDALPANADELLRMRGRGWLSSFSVGNPTPDRGLALVSAFRWDTGVQVHAANDFVDGAAAVTTGTLGNPLVGDDNAGKQVAGRVALRPATGTDRRAFGRPRSVPHARRHRRGGGRRWRRPIHADRLGRRPRIFARLLPRPLRDDRQRLEAAAHQRAGHRSAPARGFDARGRPLQDPPRSLCGGTPGSSRLQRDRRLLRARNVGGAGDARRDWRRIFGAAKSAAEAQLPAQHPRRAAA